MQIIIGDLYDPFCLHVDELLRAQNKTVLVIPNPLLDPCIFEWHLNNEESKSRLTWDGETFYDHEIESVFVRTFGWIDSAGWQKDDLSYMQSETHAALLAWLWSLNCPVVNCLSPDIWYRPSPPLLYWQPMLRCSGLKMIETLITNDPEETNNLRQQLTSFGIAGAIYSSLTTQLSYLVKETNEWDGITRMQQLSPVCFSHPHGEPLFVCVVGDKVIWNDGLSENGKIVEPLLCAFARKAGLSIVEITLVYDTNGFEVIAVDPYPKWNHFNHTASQQILENTMALLTTKNKSRKKHLQL